MVNLKDISPSRPIKKLGHIEDEATGNVYTEFCFLKPLDRRANILIDNDKARDPERVLKLVLQKGADLDLDRSSALRVVSLAIDTHPRRHSFIANRLGWRPCHTMYVTPKGAIGIPGATLIPLAPAWAQTRGGNSFNVVGTLNEWRSEVANTARYSDIIQTMIAASFGAVLLRRGTLPNFGLNLFGKEASGKTTALLCATSVIGVGREQDLPALLETRGAAFETARHFSDRLLPIRNLSTLAGGKRSGSQRMIDWITSLCEGCDQTGTKLRQSGPSEQSLIWRGIFATCSNHSLATYAQQDSDSAASWHSTSCLDVPACMRSRTTVFNRFPEKVEGSRRMWALAQLSNLRQACERQQGTALIAFIQYVALNGEIVDRRMVRRKAEFLGAVAGLNLEPELKRAAASMALIYGAGCVAISAGILPWYKCELLRATIEVFKSALAAIQQDSNATNSAIETFRLRLSNTEIPTQRTGFRVSPDRYAGFFTKLERKTKVTLHAKTFGGWFNTRGERSAVLKYLYDGGFLLMGGSKAIPSHTSCDWAQRTPRWPDGEVHKSYVFIDPFGLVGSDR